MSDDPFDVTSMPIVCGYLLPGDPATVLDINYALLAETLERSDAARGAEPDAPQLAD